ncbi:MAG: hypothetical protein AAGG48_14495 [Planctomycetota bacterium]
MTTGIGGAFTLGTTGLSANIISITPPNEGVDTDIPLPHLGLSKGDYMPYMPGDLKEGDEFSIEVANDHNTNIPTGTEETCTWTKPIGTHTTAANWVFPGYVKRVQENPNEMSERSTITLVVKVAGTVTKNAAA